MSGMRPLPQVHWVLPRINSLPQGGRARVGNCMKTPRFHFMIRSGVLHRTVGLACLLFAGAIAQAADGRVFRSGAHRVDVTPTNYPVLVNAMFTERSATNAVDRLFVRALALDDGATRLVLAVVDTCMVARDLIDRAKQEANRVTGIPTDKMLVSATHTHSAPSAMGCLGSRMDTNYATFLGPRIAEAIIGAFRNLQPAQIGWGLLTIGITRLIGVGFGVPTGC